MVNQYPHTLIVGGAADASTDANGNWQPGTDSAPVSYPCRFEIATNNQPKPVIDGTVADYSGLVYMPLPDIPIETGTQVTVKSGVRTLASGPVLQYAEGDVLRMNARLWL